MVSRVLAVVNPSSGQGDSGFERFAQAVRAAGVGLEVRELHPGASLPDLLRDADGFGAVVAAGGDGTVSGVAHALERPEVPVLAYPAGTANLIALNLGMPADPEALARVLLEDPVRQRVDLARLSYRDPEGRECTAGFTIAAGTGFDAKLIADSEALKPRFGVGAYVLSALSNANPAVAEFRLELDGEVLETSGIGVVVVNFGRMQLGLKMSPYAAPDDGLLDVVVLKARSAAGLLPELLRQMAERLGLATPEVDERLGVYQVRRVRVEASPSLPLQFDGESLEGTPPLEAHVLPGAATFLKPPA